MAHFAAPSRKIKIAKCKLGPWYNVADIFSATLPKSEVQNALLIFKGVFCAFEPSQQRGVQNAPHVKRVQRQIDTRSCVAGITPSHSTVIHHKRASRYVVLGEISHSPFTTYIFAKPDGAPERRDRISTNFGQLLRHMGMPHMRFHDTRHPNVKPKTKSF